MRPALRYEVIERRLVNRPDTKLTISLTFREFQSYFDCPLS
jgi:hypothetical protein